MALGVNGQTARWPKSGARTVRDGNHYAIDKSFDVEVTDDAPLAPKAMPAIRERVGAKIVLFERTA